MILETFNGLNIIALPCDQWPNVTHPSSIEIDPQEKVGESDAAFGYQAQVFDFMQSMWQGTVSFPPMNRHCADMWQSFILEARGGVNAFMLGDPKAALPKGQPAGAPVVNGAGQTGYSLLTRGWTPNRYNLLSIGDYLQIGYRLYKVLTPVVSDSSGHATISIWPNLRDQPADGTALVVNHCKGLFRLASPTGNKFSTNVANYGFTGFKIREAGVA